MPTTCVGGVPRICDARVIRGVVHNAAVVRVPRERLCRSQEEAVQGRVAEILSSGAAILPNNKRA